MAKKTNGKGSPTLEEMLEAIDQRIEMLQMVKLSLHYAFTTDEQQALDILYEREEAPQVTAPQPQRRMKRHTRKVTRRGNNRSLFRTILEAAGGPLTTDEVLSRAKAHKWKTVSKQPRNLVAVTLRSMAQAGQGVRHVGKDWEYVAPMPTYDDPMPVVEMPTELGV